MRAMSANDAPVGITTAGAKSVLFAYLSLTLLEVGASSVWSAVS